MSSRAEQVQGEPSCVICARALPLDVLVELSSTWVTAAREAPLPGYVCMVSKSHVVEPYELRGDARRAFWDDVSTVAEAVHAATRSINVNYEIHGNTIPHLHLHLYPRFPGDPYEGTTIDPKAGHVFSRSSEELAQLRDAIVARAHITSMGR